MTRNESLTTLTLSKWVHGGRCIAHHMGKTWFVADGLPGETVLVVLERSARNVLFGRVVEVLDPASDRVQPPCAFVDRCGGCDLQHVSIPAQREAKREVLVDAIHRIGGFARASDLVAPTLALGAEGSDIRDAGLGWRSRITVRSNAAGVLGFVSERSHEVVPVTHCVIAEPPLNSAFTTRVQGNSRVVIAVGSDGTKGVDAEPVRYSVTGQYSQQWQWTVPASAFWQVHRDLPQTLVELASVHVRPGSTWWDLYGGAGLLTSAAISAGAAGVELVERDTRSVEAARATFAQYPQVGVHQQDVAAWLATAPPPPTGIFVDPPRAGIGAEIARELVEIAPRTLVYVSCDPATLARDLRVLVEGGFALDSVQPIDAFPMTHHVETVAVLSR